jgi:hypothetical protein
MTTTAHEAFLTFRVNPARHILLVDPHTIYLGSRYALVKDYCMFAGSTCDKVWTKGVEDGWLQSKRWSLKVYRYQSRTFSKLDQLVLGLFYIQRAMEVR